MTAASTSGARQRHDEIAAYAALDAAEDAYEAAASYHDAAGKRLDEAHKAVGEYLDEMYPEVCS